MNIQIDTREKAKAIEKIVTYFDDNGIQHFRSKLYVGDYMSLDNPRLVIDRKQSLLELCGNVCQQHDRFSNELIRAKAAGIKVIVLVEHSEKIKTLADVQFWKNPRLKSSKLAVSGERLFKTLSTMQNSKLYDVEFEFCDKDHTGQRIIELLGACKDENSI